MKTVPLYGKKAAGRVAFVDDADYELVSRYRWRVWEKIRPGFNANGPYAVTQIRRGGRQVEVSMHALITGWARVDHRDHNGLNNQRRNLRKATRAQNGANRRPYPGCSSAFKGVSWRKAQGQWVASIRINTCKTHLGFFDVEEDAARAYDAAALEAWGEFAWLNFP